MNPEAILKNSKIRFKAEPVPVPALGGESGEEPGFTPGVRLTLELSGPRELAMLIAPMLLEDGAPPEIKPLADVAAQQITNAVNGKHSDEKGQEVAAPPRLVVIESPLGTRPDGTKIDPGSPEFLENERYVRACMLDCLRRGEAPYASHALYPQVLDDATPEERKQGIDAGLAWGEHAAARVVYTDRGITSGMQLGIGRAEKSGQQVEYRTVPGWARGIEQCQWNEPDAAEASDFPSLMPETWPRTGALQSPERSHDDGGCWDTAGEA